MFDVKYQPQKPAAYNPPIGLIGCGGITRHHLEGYKAAGFNVVALCDVRRESAKERAQTYYPDAAIFTDYRKLLAREDIEVVDVATHPPQRPPIIQDCLRAGKHVLSQKPFVLDLDVGRELVDLADKHNLKLAVNQNGRWAPHFSYAREAVANGLLGKVAGVHMSVHWDHTWTKGTEFEKVKHLILYDFAIHWFDMVNCLMGSVTPKRVFGSIARTQRQTIMPPLLGQALIEYDHAQASLAFDADTEFGPEDRTYVTGSKGTISSVGSSYQNQKLTVHVAGEGDQVQVFQPNLIGKWFSDGFRGTMGELLCSIEEQRTPSIDAARNLESLSLCFAAVASAESNQPVIPGTVRRMPGSI